MNNVGQPNVKELELCLVARAAEGDRDARHELFERHRHAAFRVAVRITGNEEDAFDVVQDSFIKAFEGLSGFQRGASFKTWLLRIVNNRSLDYLRSRKVCLAVSLDDGDERGPTGDLLPAGGDQPDARLEQHELKKRIEQAMGSLPPEQRSVFGLCAGGELTYGEIAEIVGIPIGTVMSRIYHARRRLRAMLADLAPRGG